MPNSAAQSIALSIGLSALVTVACRRLRVPALLPLLVVGLVLGTSGLRVVDGDSLGESLSGLITLAIGLLIFEGALHLNEQELGRAPRAVWGLLTAGAAATWLGAAAAAHLLLGLSIPISILLGASLIVTGPTVVQPILRIIRVTPRLHTALAAEAVLVDPIGVVATITTLEVLRLYVLTGPQLGLAKEGMWIFAKPLLGGAGVGVVMGLIGYWLLRAIGRAGKPEPQLLNLVAIGVCMTCVGLGEAITPEAGLAAVTICGVLMARARVLGATELRAFKELLAVILVGTLFVLLASRFNAERLRTLTWREGLFVLVLVFCVRPVVVWLSTWRSALDSRERLFAATFAPRGIVALSVATVASTDLGRVLAGPEGTATSERAHALLEDSRRLELVMFVVIAGTVLLASTVSPVVALILKVRASTGTAVLLVGAHPLSVALAQLLGTLGIETRIVDSNETHVEVAVRAGIPALVGDATDLRWMDDVGSPHGTGSVIAWTGNHDVDQLVARWAEARVGEGHAALWSNKPARGPLERADISGGDPIEDWLLRAEDGRAVLIQTEDSTRLYRVLGWVQDQKFRLSTPGSKRPDAAPGIVYIGLALGEHAASDPAAAPRGRQVVPEAESEGDATQKGPDR